MADITQVQLTDTFSTLVDRLNEAIARANALGTQAAVVITGGTISGVTLASSAINSTPIGATTPSTGRFSSISLENPLAIAQGGTGATTAGDARTNLGFANASNLTEGVLSDERIPNLSANKIVDGIFTVGDFSVDMSLTKSGAAKIAAKGTGSSEAYSYLSLESDESEDKGWQIFHRKDAANRLAFYYNLTQMAAYFDPTTRGFVVGSTTSGGSPAVGSINAKSYYVDGVKISGAATSDLAGIIELATNAEAIAGADTSRAVTPAGVAAAIADRIATSGEAIALTSTTELITPALLAAVFGNTTARTTLDVVGRDVLMSFDTVSSNTQMLTTDKGRTKRVTGSVTISFEAAATLGNGWWMEFVIDGDYNDNLAVTFDPNSTETIDDRTTVIAYGGERFKVYCDGSKFRTTRATEVFLGTITVGDGSNNPFQVYTAGKFLADPEITHARMTLKGLMHAGSGDRTYSFRTIDEDGNDKDSFGDYNVGSLQTMNSFGPTSQTATSMSLTPSAIPAGIAIVPHHFKITKSDDVTLIEYFRATPNDLPTIRYVLVDSKLGGIEFRISGTQSGTYLTGGTLQIWGTRQRGPQ